jgi:hypothetical protein
MTTTRTPQRPAEVISSGQPAPRQRTPPRLVTLKRAAMAGATAFVTVNIWTGAPVVALWVGSQVVGRKALSMAAVGVVVAVLAVLEGVLALALTWLNSVYDQLIGRPRVERRDTWLRSMRAESEGHVSQRVGITMLERIVMVNVYIAVIGLIVWWVLFAGAPTSNICNSC